ncbi:P-type conjugative transfer protein TrbL [Dyella sp. BiH032]|uniref:P-type conjugative transfer protein TrbL n=1 Tax=Dyella sp. BiH032 TaxID=3075430 RepID=UPI0028929B1B|nr:P-type conjugative transfer protein TrbL [Dyella sp. BiH032]WNL48165.1 P-type conjugative transfer protein TrbL [Dyella sp. BiH032]
MFNRQQAPALILDSAKRMFWMLATMGLVWNMGVVLLRRGDFGELFLELIRFIVFSGLFYWLLTESTSKDGFVYKIIDSFALMGEKGKPEVLAGNGDNIIQLGLNVFYKVLQESQNWDDADILVASGLAIGTLVALTLLAAQLALVIIMAWMLAYAGIFLLGLGGTRWTSPVAIGFYKNVLALGASLMLLAFLIKFGEGFLEQQAAMVLAGSGQGLDYVPLADMLVVSLLLAVLGMKVPGLIYTTVTGSPLGLLGGTASLAGSAFSAGGSHVYSTAYSSIAHYRQGGGSRGPAPSPDLGSGGGGSVASAIDAIRGSHAAASMEDVIFTPMNASPHVAGAPEGSVFGQAQHGAAQNQMHKSPVASAVHQHQGEAAPWVEQIKPQAQSASRNTAQGTSTQSAQSGAVAAAAAQRVAATSSESVTQQARSIPATPEEQSLHAQTSQSHQQASAALATDGSGGKAPSTPQATSVAMLSSGQEAMPTHGMGTQQNPPLGLPHAKPDMLAGNIKLNAAQQPHVPSAGFQPEALRQSAPAASPGTRRADGSQPSADMNTVSTSSSPSLAAKGTPPNMPATAMGATADGRQSLPAPSSSPLMSSTVTGAGTTMTEQMARVSAKVRHNISARLPVENKLEAGRSATVGGAPPLAAEDEVAAFRDRHLSDSSDG